MNYLIILICLFYGFVGYTQRIQGNGEYYRPEPPDTIQPPPPAHIDCLNNNGISIFITATGGGDYKIPTSSVTCLPNATFLGIGGWTILNGF